MEDFMTKILNKKYSKGYSSNNLLWEETKEDSDNNKI